MHTNQRQLFTRISHCAFTLLACLLCAIPASDLYAAPTQWTVGSGGNGHFYEAFSVPGGISWTDANAAAQSAGGHLATIANLGENSFIFDLIDDSLVFWKNVGGDSRGPWLGGLQAPSSPEPGGGWGWVTAEPFAYTLWHLGEPNNDLPDEDKLHFFANGENSISPTWNDLSDESGPNNPVGYIVETVPEPSSLAFATLALVSFVCMIRRRF